MGAPKSNPYATPSNGVGGRFILMVHHDADLYGADKSLLMSVSAFMANGFVPIVVLPRDGPLVSALLEAGAEVHLGPVCKVSRSRLKRFGWVRVPWDLASALRFLSLVVADRNVVLVHSNSIAVLGGALWALWRRVPHLQHVREIIVQPRILSKAFPRLLRVISTWCVCNSDATRDWLIGECPALAARSSVVWNGIEGVRSPSNEEVQAFRRTLGVEGEEVLVTLVGRINRWKGQGILVDAAGRLYAAGLKNVRFLIVGDASPGNEKLKDVLLEKIRRSGLGAIVQHVPFTKNVDLVWAASDVAVVPSTDPEPFGRVAIEAMAHGLPVVASAHGGLREIVVHGSTGLLVEPGDAAELSNALSLLVSSPAMRVAYGEAGRRRQTAQFSEAEYARKMISLVGRLTECARTQNVALIHQASEMYGSDKVLLNVALALKARGSFVPIVVLPRRGPLHDALAQAGVEVHVAEVMKISRGAFGWRGIARLLQSSWRAVAEIDNVMNGRPIAVVHSNTLAVLGGALWAWRRNVPHLWHVHEIVVAPRIATRGLPLLLRLLADRVVSNSRRTEEWLLRWQPRLAPRSTVVFNGLPAVRVPSRLVVDDFRARIGASENDVVVTLAGRLNSWKGQGLLIDAASLLRERGSGGNVLFVIAGDAVLGQEHLRDELVAKVRSVGMEERVVFLPFVDDIWPMWFGSQIAVVPSTQPEPFGLVAIEAMAASLPVVAAAHGGLLDIVQHERTGLLFEPGNAVALADALDRLIGDGSYRERLGRSGAVRQAEQFSLDAQVDGLERAYRDLIGA